MNTRSHFHMSVHVRYLLMKPDHELIEWFERSENPPTASEIRAYLQSERERGRTLWNNCEATNPDGSCACPQRAFER